MSAMTGRCGLIPEQVWDAEPIPRRALFPGKPTGSAMPLVWAHAEFVKLALSRGLGRPCDRPEPVWERYRGRRPMPACAVWTPRFPSVAIDAGRTLLVCLPAAATVHYGIDAWERIADVAATDRGLGLYVAELPSASLARGQCIRFTFYWNDSASWEGRDYETRIR